MVLVLVLVVVGQPVTNSSSGSSFDVLRLMFDPELDNISARQ